MNVCECMNMSVYLCVNMYECVCDSMSVSVCVSMCDCVYVPCAHTCAPSTADLP